MKSSTYYMGDGHSKWGIWNKVQKQFQFGICEDTPMLAEARLFQKIGEDARKWRFEAREINTTYDTVCEYDEAFTQAEMLEETGFCKACKIDCPNRGKESHDSAY